MANYVCPDSGVEKVNEDEDDAYRKIKELGKTYGFSTIMGLTRLASRDVMMENGYSEQIASEVAGLVKVKE